MLVLVTYDVRAEDKAGQRRLRRVARLCQSFGQRVQFSVFECVVDPAQFASLKARLVREIDPASDSLRFYFLGSHWLYRVAHVGAKASYDPEGPLIV